MEYIYLAALQLNGLPHVGANQNFVTTLISIVIGIVAAACLLVIVLSGLRYILSQGDPQAISKAKGGIIYALIGLAVVILAQVIVTFVLKAAT